jgi:CRP-like cAMP-binding protein
MEKVDILQKLFADYPIERYKRNQIILKADINPTDMYYLEEGFVRLYAVSAQNEVIFSHIFKPKSCFPLTWLFNGTSNRYFYEALGKVTLRKAPVWRVKKVITKKPDLLNLYAGKLLLGIDGLLARMESLVLDDAYGKTVLLFLYLAKSFGIKEGSRIIISIPLSQREVASWIGVTRETASLMVEKLKAKGLIDFKGRQYVINNLKLLQKER